MHHPTSRSSNPIRDVPRPCKLQVNKSVRVSKVPHWISAQQQHIAKTAQRREDTVHSNQSISMSRFHFTSLQSNKSSQIRSNQIKSSQAVFATQATGEGMSAPKRPRIITSSSTIPSKKKIPIPKQTTPGRISPTVNPRKKKQDKRPRGSEGFRAVYNPISYTYTRQ